MAATAAAAMSSSFSPSIYTVKCLRSSNNLSPDHHLYHLNLIMSPSRIFLPSSSSSSNSYATEPLVSLNAGSKKFRWLRICTACVAEEQVAVTDEVEEVGVAEEEQQQVAEPKAEKTVSAVEESVEAAAEVSGEGGEDEGEGEGVALNTKLYFGNLPYSVDSAQLAGIIQDYGSPELIEVLYHKDTGRSRGFAFVTMSTVEDCNVIIENLDGREFMGRTLRVNFSDKPREKVPLYPETEYKLFVGNLSWTVTSESLTKAFQDYGNVVGARVLFDGDTGRSRGYGFVCYSTKSEMDTALKSLDGAELEGRALRVSMAEGKRS